MKHPTVTAAATEMEGVSLYTLANADKMVVKIFNYGGIIQSVSFPDSRGQSAEVTLGFANLADYVAYNPAPYLGHESGAGVYFGALIGRYANRIARGELTVAGRGHKVPVNNGPNALHGGTAGFDQKIWVPEAFSGPEGAFLRLSCVADAGEMGFPGALSVVATYSLDDENRLELSFSATTSEATVLNLTNHSYWNLAGEGSGPIYHQVLRINADSFTPVDETLIPTGAIQPVAGTPFDFTTPKAIGEHLSGGAGFSAVDNEQLRRCHGYDHNWVLRQTSPASLVLAATASDPSSGRELSVYTTQPGLQFYSGNFLTGSIAGSSGHLYRQSAGFALETQHFPDSPNQAGFPSTELGPGETYDERSVFQLSIPSR